MSGLRCLFLEGPLNAQTGSFTLLKKEITHLSHDTLYVILVLYV
jgi:hypothetical protein